VALSAANAVSDTGGVPALLHPHCALCTQLLEEYIAAGNEAIDTREQLNRTGQAGGPVNLSSLLERNLEHRNELRKRLVVHQERHRFHSRSSS
jgi:hypothetical protein